MPHDSELVDETQAWLQKSKADLEVADLLLAAEPPFAAHVVFHAQQAAEKAMKGFLTWHSSIFGKTHDLKELGIQCLRFEPGFERLVTRAAALTQYAWKHRYPGGPLEPPVAEAEEALALAREVYQAILSRLPEEVRP